MRKGGEGDGGWEGCVCEMQKRRIVKSKKGEGHEGVY